MCIWGFDLVFFISSKNDWKSSGDGQKGCGAIALIFADQILVFLGLK